MARAARGWVGKLSCLAYRYHTPLQDRLCQQIMSKVVSAALETAGKLVLSFQVQDRVCPVTKL